MAATVGSVIIQLKAQTAKFDAGMKKASARMTRFSKTVSTLSPKLKLLGALSTTAVVAGFTAMVKSNLETLDSSIKLARQLDVNVNALRRFRHAAELAGAGADTADAALATLSKRLGEAAREGKGPAAVAAADLGLLAEELAQLPVLDAVDKISDGLRKEENAIKRAAIASNFFSKANQNMVLVLNEGSASLDQLEASFGGLDISKEAASNIEATTDALAQMQVSLDSIGETLTVETAPALEDTAQLLERASNGTADVGKSAKLSAFDLFKMATGLAAVERGLEGVNKLTGDEAEEFLKREQRIRAQNIRDAVRKEGELALKDAGTLFDTMEKAAKKIADFGKSADDLAVEQLKLLRGVGDAEVEQLRRLQDRFNQLTEDAQKRKEAEESLKTRRDAFSQFFRTTAPAALERGTAAAFSAANRIRLESGRGGMPELIRKADEQIAEQQKMVEHLAVIEDNITVLEEAPL